MSNISESKIEELVREKIAGKSYSAIRKDLLESGMAEEEIRGLIRQVDQKVLNEATTIEDRKRAQQWYRAGFVLALIGLILSLAYNSGNLFENLPALVLYAPFFAGIIVMIYGKAILRKQSPPSEKSPGAIRRRRPYK